MDGFWMGTQGAYLKQLLFKNLDFSQTYLSF
ncbi:hypothetical protein CsSME_00034706 [Camellia sinensis var. sinensis]